MDVALLETTSVVDAMRREFAIVSPEMPLIEAASLIRAQRTGALAVHTGTDTPAIITEYDVVKAVAERGERLAALKVADYMSVVVVAATPDWSLGRALTTMVTGGIRHLLVVDGSDTIGMLTMRSVMKVVAGPSETQLPQDTVELAAVDVAEDVNHLLHNLRRGAKQHMVAAKCPCELDWLEILIGQLEERPDLNRVEVLSLWDVRMDCPALHAEGGGAD